MHSPYPHHDRRPPADSYLVIRALLDEFVRCGMAARLHLARITQHADRARRSRGISGSRAGHTSTSAQPASSRSAPRRPAGRPVAVTCTSGTAAANLLPAVIEAHEAGVPLIVLTADRPPELRDIGAGQTIDQIKLYGDAVKWFFELGRARAVSRAAALGARRSPVAPTGPRQQAGPGRCTSTSRCASRWCSTSRCRRMSPAAAGARTVQPWVQQKQAGTSGLGAAAAATSSAKTVIIAGDLGSDRAAGAQLADVAARAQVPLLADPLSGARSGSPPIAHFDLILRDPRRRQRTGTDCVSGSASCRHPSRCAAGWPSLDAGRHTSSSPPTSAGLTRCHERRPAIVGPLDDCRRRA